jgi:ATP-binding cassette subfamily F protein 3
VHGGRVSPFDGDLDDYRRHVLGDAGQAAPAAVKPASRVDPAAARRAAAEKRAATAPLRQRAAKAETEIANLTRQLRRLDATLADGALFTLDPTRATELSKTRATVVEAIAAAEEEWLAASAALESA